MVAVPESLYYKLFEEVDGGQFSGHLREAKINSQLRKQYWWPGMRSEIQKWCKACLICSTCQIRSASYQTTTSSNPSGRSFWLCWGRCFAASSNTWWQPVCCCVYGLPHQVARSVCHPWSYCRDHWQRLCCRDHQPSWSTWKTTIRQRAKTSYLN